VSTTQENRQKELKAALDAAIEPPLSPREALGVLEEHMSDVEAWMDALREDIKREEAES
jgi:hypothetical protein